MNFRNACHQHTYIRTYIKKNGRKKVGVFLFIERYERKREKGTDVSIMFIHRDESREGEEGNNSKKRSTVVSLTMRVHHHH